MEKASMMSDRSKSGLSAMPELSSVMAGLSSKSCSAKRFNCGVEKDGWVKVVFRKEEPVLCFAVPELKTDRDALKDCMRRGLGCAAAVAKELSLRLDGEDALQDGAGSGLPVAAAGGKLFVCDSLDGEEGFAGRAVMVSMFVLEGRRKKKSIGGHTHLALLCELCERAGCVNFRALPLEVHVPKLGPRHCGTGFGEGLGGCEQYCGAAGARDRIVRSSRVESSWLVSC